MPPSDVAEGGSDISKILFVNRCEGGCTINPGPNDARSNTSNIIDEQITLGEFAHSDQVWSDTIACIREVYAPYDVEVTTTDPGEEKFHHEAILAGTNAEAGQPGGVGGIAPLASDCSPSNNVISFSFANSLGPSWVDLCWTAAQESAHAFGLDHAFDCSDPMTYLEGCGQKFFRDEAFPCGEFSERPCRCTGNTQNSHKKLLSVFGEGTLPSPPEVEVLLPNDGDAVEQGFAIYASALHKRGVQKVEFYLNGWLWGEKEGHDFPDQDEEYFYVTPDDLPDGNIDIEIIGYNDLGVPATASISVTKGSPCQSADSCLDGQLCEGGKCFWPEPEGELGDACERDMDCKSLLCPSDGTDRFCSESCFPSIEGQCPMGFECLEANAGDGVCWPADGGDGPGGCCSVGSGNGAHWLELSLFGLLLAFVSRRRRRRHRSSAPSTL